MAKTLMNTSEKSNFILNMTEETYTKLATCGLAAACFTVSLLTAMPEINSDHTYSIATVGLAIPGVFCLITALIAIMKKYVDPKKLLPVIAFAALIGWSTVSMLDSYDKHIGFYGFPQRGEGVLSTIFYCGFFITGMTLKRKKAIRLIIDSIILSGLLNSVWALIQIFTPNHKFSHYSQISIFFDFAASGLAHSPIFLAFLLTMSLTAALVTAVTESDLTKRVFCIGSSVIFAFVMLYTYNRMIIFGLIFAAVAAILAIFISKSPKIRLVTIAAPLAGFVLAFSFINIGIGHTIFKFQLRDGYILWTGDSYKRISASGNYQPKSIDISDVSDVYSHINSKTANILSDHKLTGSGPEQLLYPQIYTLRNIKGAKMDSMTDIISVNIGTFDKCYNEYLYIGATRGIIALISLVVLVLSILWISMQNVRKNHDKDTLTLFFITLGGALGFILCCSNIVIAPIFWAAAGASCASVDKIYLKGSKDSENNKKTDNSKKDASKPAENKTNDKPANKKAPAAKNDQKKKNSSNKKKTNKK